MKRALVTFAVGEHEQLFELSLPPMYEYAGRHGYELITRPPKLMTRPPSWHKVTAVLGALAAGYDEVLWVDADVLMLDTSVDIADEAHVDSWQVVTRLHTNEGDMASVGVWLVRPELRDSLEAQWRLDRYRHHPWWEMAAMLDLLGFTPNERPVRHVRTTELYRHTQFVSTRVWNQLYLQVPWGDSNLLDGTRFVHVGPGSTVAWRLDAMRAIARDHARITEGAATHG